MATKQRPVVALLEVPFGAVSRLVRSDPVSVGLRTADLMPVDPLLCQNWFTCRGSNPSSLTG